jgi:hypothetical protein
MRETSSAAVWGDSNNVFEFQLIRVEIVKRKAE